MQPTTIVGAKAEDRSSEVLSTMLSKYMNVKDSMDKVSRVVTGIRL